jgi:hypothetical protein
MRGANSTLLVGDLTSELYGSKLDFCDLIRLSLGAWILKDNDAMLQALI